MKRIAIVFGFFVLVIVIAVLANGALWWLDAVFS